MGCQFENGNENVNFLERWGKTDLSLICVRLNEGLFNNLVVYMKTSFIRMKWKLLLYCIGCMQKQSLSVK